MMRGASGALALAVATLLVCCSADPHQESEVSANDHISGDHYDVNGHKPRNLDPLGGGNLVRQVRESRHFVPYVMSRRFDYASPYSNGRRELWPVAPSLYGGYYGDGLPKRNFDEIDRSGLDNFVRKRNVRGQFDEIDATKMDFPESKRYYRQNGPNNLGIESLSALDNFVRNVRHQFDEIDASHMGFPDNKRFYQQNGPNNIDSPV